MQDERIAAGMAGTIEPPARASHRSSKRHIALEHVAQTATALVAALDAEPPAGAVAIYHANLRRALDELVHARARTRLDLEPVKARPGDDTRDARGWKRPIATTTGYHAGRTPPNKGRRYPPDPPTVTEIFMLMRACPDTPTGRRLKVLIPFLWRTGLRISEALDVYEGDLNPAEGSVVVRRGKGGKRRIVGMDQFGWDMLRPWLKEREQYPPGPVFCVVSGPTAGRAWAYPDVSKRLRQLGRDAGLRKRIAAHQFRHALAVDLVREGHRLDLLQRQLGHSDLGITTTYLMSVSAEEVVGMSSTRRTPTMPVPDLMEVLGA